MTLDISGESLAEIMGPVLADLEIVAGSLALQMMPLTCHRVQDATARLRTIQAILREGRLTAADVTTADATEPETVPEFMLSQLEDLE